MTETGFKLCKRAIVLDFACIAVAVSVLLLAYKGLLQQWAMLCGLIIAVLLMTLSLYYYRKGRRLLNAAAQDEAAAKAAADSDEASAHDADTADEQQ